MAGHERRILPGLSVLSRSRSTRWGRVVKFAAIAFGVALFLSPTYVGAAAVLPPPRTVLGPIATYRLTDRTMEWVFRLVNSLPFDPYSWGCSEWSRTVP